MSATPSPSSSESSGSFWSVANIVICGLLALFAGFWGISFLVGGLSAAAKLRAPKEIVAEASASAPTPAAASAPVAAVAAAPAPAGPAQELALGVDAVNPMGYNKKAFTVKAGQPVSLTFNNIGGAAPLPHNVVIGKAGSKNALLAASMVIMSDPNGMAKNYVPADPNVVAATKLVQAGQSETITFTPASPGEYPFFCMFPGHAMLMNGTITAE
jgi:azurin